MDNNNRKPILGISIGDMNGIGVEVILKTFSDERMFDYCTPIVYGSSKAVSYHRNVYKMDDFQYKTIKYADRYEEGVLNVINCWEEQVTLSLGKSDAKHGVYALRALEDVATDLQQGKLDAVITAPINKYHISLVEDDFRGQTEFFATKFGVKQSLMMLVSDVMRMALVTNHVPISEVASKLSNELIYSKINLLSEALRRDFMVDKPKIAVLALNPHAGDEGLIGKEDDDMIRPVVKYANERGVLVFGPYAADGFFGTGVYRQFDGILAMYHDQGLVPFKALSFGQGVNFTAGLPIVRTSPDHGTAYDIAGKFIAEHESFRKAVFMALDIAKNRKQYDEMHENTLQKQSLIDRESQDNTY